MLRRIGFIALLYALLGEYYDTFTYSISDFSDVAETGNFTCDEVMRWVSTEKHYSNDRKKVLFSLLKSQSCINKDEANIRSIELKDISYGWAQTKNQKSFFYNPHEKGNAHYKDCSIHDDYAVSFLSNFSINNNFSHFLHGLLRLFCALLDARYIVWDKKRSAFRKQHNYTIWLDENFRLTDDKRVWLNSFDSELRSLAKVPAKGQCIASNRLLYGNGCTRLLPPEKWFGYPGCRAAEVLPAFGTFLRQRYMALPAEELRIIDDMEYSKTDPGLRVAFAVRDVGAKTGMRQVSNLEQVQSLIKKTQHIRSSMENVTFEVKYDIPYVTFLFG